MELRPLGSSDLVVSAVGLGCNNFGGRLDLGQTRAVVDAALEAGVTFFDTADVYGNRGGSERFLGEILEGRREQVVLATKFGGEMGYPAELGSRGSRPYIRYAIDRSLDRLRTDRVDLYYYHHPDGRTPLIETIGALGELLEEGKTRAVGVSNFSADQLSEAASIGVPIAALQNEYSLLEREAEAEVLPLCRQLGIGFVPYFPLGSGLLTGKYRPGQPAPPGSRLEGRELSEQKLATVEELERFADQRGHTLLELAIGALLSQDGVVSVIAGATTPEQVRANAAAGSWTLSPGDLRALVGRAQPPT